MKTLITSSHADAMRMTRRSTLEKAEIKILLLPKRYERSKRKMKMFITGSHANAMKMTQGSTLEKTEINIILLPKQYERSEKK